jgi:hypothetical protein
MALFRDTALFDASYSIQAVFCAVSTMNTAQNKSHVKKIVPGEFFVGIFFVG